MAHFPQGVHHAAPVVSMVAGGDISSLGIRPPPAIPGGEFAQMFPGESSFFVLEPRCSGVPDASLQPAAVRQCISCDIFPRTFNAAPPTGRRTTPPPNKIVSRAFHLCPRCGAATCFDCIDEVCGTTRGQYGSVTPFGGVSGSIVPLNSYGALPCEGCAQMPLDTTWSALA